MSAILEYTGHPLVDVGVATICAFANKPYPQELTYDDLDAIADYMEKAYVEEPLKSALTVVFTSNAGFSQPSWEKTPEKRREYARKVLRAYKPGTPRLAVRCVFTGKPAVGIALGLKEDLPPGRTFRQHVPLTTAEDTINFYPYGEAGLPVSGEALLAIHAFPLGSLKVEGKFLVIHTAQPELQYLLCKRFLERNLTLIDAARRSGSTKIPEPEHRAATAFIEALIDVEETRKEAEQWTDTPVSVTAYHLTNSGQGVDLEIYHLPAETMGFIKEAMKPKHREQWGRICARGWQIVAAKRRRAGQDSEPKPQFNVLYEDLLRLPEEAARFIRRYFLRVPEHTKNADDPRRTYSLRSEYELVSWSITDLFLEKVVGMDRNRIDQIRALGDALAEYVNSENDRRFFRTFLTARKYEEVRSALIKVNLSCLRHGRAPVVAFDPYIAVFEEGLDLPHPDWRLARDLTVIRMIERLYELGWLQAHVEDLPEAESVEEDARREAVSVHS